MHANSALPPSRAPNTLVPTCETCRRVLGERRTKQIARDNEVDEAGVAGRLSRQ